MQNLKSYGWYKSVDILVDILYNIYKTNLYRNQLKYIPQLSHDHLLEYIEHESQLGNIFDMSEHLKDFDRIISGSIYNHHIDLPLNYEEISDLSINTISFRLNRLYNVFILINEQEIINGHHYLFKDISNIINNKVIIKPQKESTIIHQFLPNLHCVDNNGLEQSVNIFRILRIISISYKYKCIYIKKQDTHYTNLLNSDLFNGYKQIYNYYINDLKLWSHMYFNVWKIEILDEMIKNQLLHPIEEFVRYVNNIKWSNKFIFVDYIPDKIIELVRYLDRLIDDIDDLHICTIFNMDQELIEVNTDINTFKYELQNLISSGIDSNSE